MLQASPISLHLYDPPYFLNGYLGSLAWLCEESAALAGVHRGRQLVSCGYQGCKRIYEVAHNLLRQRQDSSRLLWHGVLQLLLWMLIIRLACKLSQGNACRWKQMGTFGPASGPVMGQLSFCTTHGGITYS